MGGWRACLALSAALLLPGVAWGQVVRGSVMSAVDSTPLPGVVVLLVGSAGTAVDRALTNERGEFRLDGPSPGRYRVRTQRIGFRPVTTEPFELRSLEEITRRIVLAGVPVSLDVVRVAARSVCRSFTDDSVGPAAIWQQARTALMAAELTSRARLEATVLMYHRTLEPYSGRVREQSSYFRGGATSRVWTARPLDSIRATGYVRQDADGGTTYFAPDLEILLSDAFVEDHCFHVARSPDPRVVGIAFEPTRDRSRVPEIRGTVWLDRRTSELRRMEYRYANVSRAQERGEAGGEMTFARLRNGGWVISRWSIRMPTLERRVVSSLGLRGGATTVEERLLETRVSGGDLVVVRRGRDTLWARHPVRLRGVVLDSASGAALAGARVRIRGTSLAAVSDSAGAFVMPDVLPGDYTLDVATPGLDSLGVAHGHVLRFADTAAVARIAVPDARALATALCGAASGPRPGIVTGRLRIAGDSVPPRNVSVYAEWTAYAVREVGGGVLVDRPRARSDGRVDAAGGFRICGVPVDTELLVGVVARDTVLARSPVRIPPGARVTRIDLVIDRATRP